MRAMRIGRKLLIGYVIMALVTLASSGGVSFILIERYLNEHEREQLDFNVKNLAGQIAPLMIPKMQVERLKDMVGILSLFGDFRTVVLDKNRNMVIQSAGADNAMAFGAPSGAEQRFQDTIFAGLPLKSTEKVLIGQEPSGIIWHISRTPAGPGGGIDLRYLCTLGTGNRSAEPANDSAPRNEAIGVRTIDSYNGSVVAEIDGPAEVAGYLVLWHVNDHVSSTLRYFGATMLASAAAAVFLATLLGFSMSRGLVKSLKTFGRQAERIEAGDFKARATVPSESILEIRELASGFDRMVSTIEIMIKERDADRTALRRFVADASHEIRTPLSAISNFVELLQGAAAEDQGARKRFLSECERQVDRLNWINKNLLDLARLDSGMQVLDLRDYDVSDLIREAISLSAARFPSRTIVENIPDGGLVAHCDREWILVALCNLIDNALKYSSEDRRVEVGAALGKEGRILELWIRDDGEGIAGEDLPHIFKRFYRGKTGKSGSGLGLAMAESIVGLHGGSIAVATEIDIGSRFSILLPVVAVPAGHPDYFETLIF
jgi:signal transduction histidine kinase